MLYRDKDYAGEAEYVHSLIQRNFPGAKTVLDLGCGTGRHDLLLAEKGYTLTGVEISEEMLAVANSQLPPLSPRQSSIRYLKGDVRSVRLGKTFDVVVSLFHVMSYHTTNKDLADAFATAKAHLEPDGIFIFDCWYGPAVLTDRPSVRVKRIDDEHTIVTRIAEPVMHPNENVVDVNYHVFVRDKATGEVDEMKETHRMRYLFYPEIEDFLREAGMSIITASEWMSGRTPGFDTWGVCFVARNRMD